jgi:hypothetical protein
MNRVTRKEVSEWSDEKLRLEIAKTPPLIVFLFWSVVGAVIFGIYKLVSYMLS